MQSNTITQENRAEGSNPSLSALASGNQSDKTATKRDRRAYYAVYQQSESFKQSVRKYLKSDKLKAVRGAYKKKLRAEQPEKLKARDAVTRALKKGTLVRPEACACGSTGRIHAHHTDYSKPLEVMWLCPRCHVDLHRQERAINLPVPVLAESLKEHARSEQSGNVGGEALESTTFHGDSHAFLEESRGGQFISIIASLVCILATSALADCPPEGDAKPGSLEQTQNPLKNRTTFPDQIDPSITLDAILAPGDDRERFEVGSAATITGYVALVKPGGLETCECHDPDILDTHIAIVADPADAKDSTKHVILEVTYHQRQTMDGIGVDWSTETLKRTLVGHWVTFTGYTFADLSHVNNAVNTNPTGAHNWRATVTELHPVTGIQIADNPSVVINP